MRTFCTFLMLFVLAALISGLLTYPVWALIHTFADVPIHRVMARIGMLVLGIATIMFLRNRGLADKATLGYGIPRPQFVRQMLIGLAASLALMAPLIAILFFADALILSPAFLATATPVLFVGKSIALGLIAGLASGFAEETFCRGAMFSTIKRESGLLLAIVLPALLYGATHFMGGQLRIPADQATYLSGLDVTLNLFQKFSTPMTYIDSFAALAMLGVLLALVRMRTGIGLHAGGASIIWVLNDLADQNQQSSLLWLAGSYRDVIGLAALVWFAVIALVYWRVSNPNKLERT
jgi:uncharacterized protein